MAFRPPKDGLYQRWWYYWWEFDPLFQPALPVAVFWRTISKRAWKWATQEEDSTLLLVGFHENALLWVPYCWDHNNGPSTVLKSRNLPSIRPKRTKRNIVGLVHGNTRAHVVKLSRRTRMTGASPWPLFFRFNSFWTLPIFCLAPFLKRSATIRNRGRPPLRLAAAAVQGHEDRKPGTYFKQWRTVCLIETAVLWNWSFEAKKKTHPNVFPFNK